MTKNFKKLQLEKKIWIKSPNLSIPIPYASIKNIQVTEEAFSSQKKPSNTSKHELLQIFLLLWVIFALLCPDPDSESGSGSTDPIESDPIGSRYGSGSATCVCVRPFRNRFRNNFGSMSVIINRRSII
jgi:hypothetical protein